MLYCAILAVTYMSKKIAIIGAGISGLTCAYELQKAGFDVAVFEKEDFVGGRMSTRVKEGYLFDTGADHMGNCFEGIKSYCRELGIVWEKMRDPLYGIYRDGKIYPAYKVTNKLSQLRLAFFAWCLRNKTDFFDASTAVRYDNNNAYDYMRRVAGFESSDYLAEGFTSGYQFHRAREASKAALIAFFQSIKFHDWFLHRTKGGMIALPNALAERLEVHLSASVKEVIPGKTIKVKFNSSTEEFDAVVLACTANVSKEILKNQSKQQKDLLENTKYSSTISLSYKIDADVLPKETVIFSPFIESQAVAAYTNQKMKGEEMIHDGKSLVCVWLHEEFAQSIFNLTDQEILERCKAELARVSPWLKDTNQLESFDLQKWAHAMPKFSQGHLTRVVNFLDDGQGGNNIFLCGDYLNAPWTEGALRSGQRVAKDIIQRLR